MPALHTGHCSHPSSCRHPLDVRWRGQPRERPARSLPTLANLPKCAWVGSISRRSPRSTDRLYCYLQRRRSSLSLVTRPCCCRRRSRPGPHTWQHWARSEAHAPAIGDGADARQRSTRSLAPPVRRQPGFRALSAAPVSRCWRFEPSHARTRWGNWRGACSLTCCNLPLTWWSPRIPGS